MQSKLYKRVAEGDFFYDHSEYISVTEKTFGVSHVHDNYELIYFIKGAMLHTIEGRTYELKRGDIVLTPPSVMHTISGMPERVENYERHLALINLKRLPENIRKRIPKNKYVFTCENNKRIEDLFLKLDDYFKHFEGEELFHIVYNIIEEVIFNLAIMDEEEKSAVVNPLVERAIAYISENISTIRDIEEISNSLYVTKSHLHHVFVREMKVTPGKYITSKRLLLAKKKILKGARPTEIFDECGFTDYATFFRNYKNYFGYPPSSEGKVQPRKEIPS